MSRGMNRRGMGMRGMKARQQGKAPRIEQKDKHAEVPPEPEPDDGLEELTEEAGMMVDQGDGMRVVQRSPRRGPEDREVHELPDEPPTGWGDG